MKKFANCAATTLGGVAMLFSGVIYGWSVLCAPIASEFPAWTSAEMSLTFTLAMVFFCIGGLASGTLAKRVSQALRMAVAAALFWGGMTLTSNVRGLYTMYMGWGVLCGLGSGISYNAIMTCVPGLFPRSRALASGCMLMAYSAGSLAIGTAFTALTAVAGWRVVYRGIGWTGAIAMLAYSAALRRPEHNEQGGGYSSDISCSPADMVRTASFRLFFLWVVLITAAGLSVISQARPMISEMFPDLGGGVIAILAGMLSVFNGLGRMLFGALYDRKGWKSTMLVVNLCALLGGVILTLAQFVAFLPLLALGFAVMGLAYGGPPTLCASVSRAFYGSEHYAVNYQIMVLNLLPASLAGTLAGMLRDGTGGSRAVFLAIIALAAAALPLWKRLRLPEARRLGAQ
ncbi:MAG: MFS transporter [Clostridia bacterium]|nr:MFS transporter [Clostridia bacterium]